MLNEKIEVWRPILEALAPFGFAAQVRGAASLAHGRGPAADAAAFLEALFQLRQPPRRDLHGLGPRKLSGKEVVGFDCGSHFVRLGGPCQIYLGLGFSFGLRLSLYVSKPFQNRSETVREVFLAAKKAVNDMAGGIISWEVVKLAKCGLAHVRVFNGVPLQELADHDVPAILEPLAKASRLKLGQGVAHRCRSPAKVICDIGVGKQVRADAVRVRAAQQVIRQQLATVVQAPDDRANPEGGMDAAIVSCHPDYMLPL